MDTASKYNFDWLCRTCMEEIVEFDANTEPQQHWKSIMDTIEECGSLQINELISQTFLYINVQLSDQLPKKICHACLHSFINAYRFQQRCLKSQHTLHTFIANRNAPLIMATTEATLEDEKNSIEFIKQEPLSKPTNQEIELGSIKTLRLLPESCDSVLMSKIRNEFFNQEQPLARNHGIKLKIPEVTEPSIAINKSIEHYILHSPNDESEFLKNEPRDHEDSNVEDSEAVIVANELCDADERYVEYADDDKINSTDTADNKTLIVETEETQVTLNKPTHNCRFCNKSFKQRRYLYDHLKRHKKRQVKKRMYEKNELGADQEPSVECNSEQNGPYEPDDDESLLGNSDDEADSVGYNIAPSLLKCHLCDETFGHKRYFSRHLNWHNKNDFAQFVKQDKRLAAEQRYKCNECGKSFYTLSGRRKHCLKHSDGISYKCPHCPLEFACSSDMFKHKIIHEPVKPYECELCDKTYKYPSMLRAHLKRVHTTERPYECSKCGKSFKVKGTLKYHRFRRSDGKPHECDRCQLKFYCAGEYNKHKIIHERIKPHACDICGVKFSRVYTLKKHRELHGNRA